MRIYNELDEKPRKDGFGYMVQSRIELIRLAAGRYVGLWEAAVHLHDECGWYSSRSSANNSLKTCLGRGDGFEIKQNIHGVWMIKVPARIRKTMTCHGVG